MSLFLLKKDGFSVFKCQKCDLSFVFPQPTPDMLRGSVYSGKYQANKIAELKKVALDSKKIRIIDYIKANIQKGKKILDIGCSNGEFIFKLKEIGYECFGVELNKGTYEIAKNNGLNVQNCILEEAGFKDSFFDVIFLGDIIEHVADPDNFIRECRRILKSEGIIIISTPNMDCFWSKSTLILYNIFGIPWSSVTPPYHLYQFSVDNLDLLMKNFNFIVKDGWFSGPPVLKYELGQTHVWGNFKRDKSLGNIVKLLLTAILYPALYSINILTAPLNQKDFGMVRVYKK
ncbi:MAG: class I SAM-dependent methyltransferase [bacterium]